MARVAVSRVVSAGAVTGGLLVGYWLPGLAKPSAGARALLGVADRLDLSDAICLTFDDGPHPQGTPAALETLAQAGARATFFLVGEQVERRPALAAEIVAAGHEIAVHCHRHRNLMRLTPRQVSDDLDRAAAAIADACDREPRNYRPPYGILTAAGLAAARRRGWTTLLWSRDGRDWQRRATSDSILARLTDGVTTGDVLLLHDADYYSAPDSWRGTMLALPRLLAELTRRGLRTVPAEVGVMHPVRRSPDGRPED